MRVLIPRRRFAVAGLMLSVAASGMAASARKSAFPNCAATTQAGETCVCDLAMLHPLQGAVGFEEVESKKDKILDDLDKQWKKLAKNPIKVVHGPGGTLYVTDHHHGADAWRLAQHATALCKINPLPSQVPGADFWSTMIDAKLVHLEDARGMGIHPSQLPPDLASLPDDPYRSLAWRLRKAGGFCRADMGHIEFAEFVWADWLRPRLAIPAGSATEPLVPAALKLALGHEAATLPGWMGGKPPGFVCVEADDGS